MNVMNFQLDIQTKDIKEAAEQELKKRMRENATRKINLLFLDKNSDQARWFSEQEKKSTECGYMLNLIDGAIVELALDEKMAGYAKRYIEQHWQAAMNKALDEAMEHKARKIAFGGIKQHAPRKEVQS